MRNYFFFVMKMMCNIRSVRLGVKRKSNAKVVVDVWSGDVGMRVDVRHKLYLLEMKCLRKICLVIGVDSWRNEEVRRRERFEVARTCGAYDLRAID